MNEYHGKIISHCNIDNFPVREDFLDDKLKNEMNDKMVNSKPLLFMPCSLSELDNYQDSKYDVWKYKILLYGILPSGQKMSVMLNNIDVYFEVIIPTSISLLDFKRDELSVEYNYQDLVPFDKLGNNENSFVNSLLDTINEASDKKNYIIKHDIIYAKPFKYYQEHPSKFVKIYFNKEMDRKKALRHLKNNKYQLSDGSKIPYDTYSDDSNSYWRIVCRDRLLSFSSWCELSDYKIKQVDGFKLPVIFVDIKNYKNYEITSSAPSYLLRDNTISCCWDIETYNPDNIVPSPERETDFIFCICMTFQFIHEKSPFLQIALSNLPAAINKDYMTIVCGNEANLILTFGQILSNINPEFITGFNDSAYDWKWVVERAYSKKILREFCMKIDNYTVDYQSDGYKSKTNDSLYTYNYRDRRIKLAGGNMINCRNLQLNGYIPFDTCLVFRKLYPNSEKYSLKFFLEQNKLSSKEDMPYKKMFSVIKNIYTACTKANYNFDGTQINIKSQSNYLDNLLNDVMLILKYCVVDALRCHDLNTIRTIISNNREIAKLSFISLNDAFYYADGMKVRNMIIAIGQQSKFGIRFSNNKNYDEERGEKFEGAYVIPPEKGLKISKLSIEENIQKAHLQNNDIKNEQSEWLCVTDKNIFDCKQIIKDHSAVVKNNDIIAHLPKCMQSFLKADTGRPIAGLDFSSLYPSIIRTFNFSPEKCIRSKNEAIYLLNKWKQQNYDYEVRTYEYSYMGSKFESNFIWHSNKIDINEEDFRFGLMPHILNDLFKSRDNIKKQMKHYDELIEQYKTDGKVKTKENEKLYSDWCFYKNYYNSKQSAVKVFMNTFYGETGNPDSPLHIQDIACNTTSQGRSQLKLAKSTVEKENFKVYYGDTDSLYISAPEMCFEKLDKQFYLGEISKLEYWTKQVEITFVEIDKIKNIVNAEFKKTSKSDFLKMAYEEVLYPVIFTAKKKYFGVPHEKKIDFKSGNIFVRGLDYIKRGKCKLLKVICTDIINKCCSVDNLYDLMELAIMAIDNVYKSSYSNDHFVQTAVWKLNGNKMVGSFVERMKQEGVIIPVNERFNYVIVKKYPYKYNHRGCQEPVSMGDRMYLVDNLDSSGGSEPLDVNKMKIDIDLNYYMKSSIIGQLGRLITYHEKFHVDAHDENNNISLDAAEKKIYIAACKFITDYCSKYDFKYYKLGNVYQAIFRKTNKEIKTQLENFDEITSLLLTSKIDVDEVKESLEKITCSHAKKIIKKMEGDIRERISKKYPSKLIASDALKIYYRLEIIRKNECKKKEINTLIEFNNIRSDIQQIYIDYNQYLSEIIEEVKKTIKISDVYFKPVENPSDDVELKIKSEDININDQTKFIENRVKKYIKKIRNNNTLKTLKNIYYKMISIKLIIYRTEYIIQYLRKCSGVNTTVKINKEEHENDRNSFLEKVQNVNIKCID